MAVLPTNDTDQAGYLITTEFGLAPLGAYQLKNVAPYVYGTSFEGDTVTYEVEEEVAAPQSVVADQVDEEGTVVHGDDAPVVSPEPEASLSDPFANLFTHVGHDVEDVEHDVKDDVDHDVLVAKHDVEAVEADVRHDIDVLEDHVKTDVEDVVHDIDAIKDIPESVLTAEAEVKEVEEEIQKVESVLHNFDPAGPTPEPAPVVSPTEGE